MRVRRTRNRAGAAIIWIVVMLVSLASFCSLAVDLGRVQVAKSELQHAADAAARYAAAGLAVSADEARRRAVDAARDNRVDGTAMVLEAGDVEFGVWDD